MSDDQLLKFIRVVASHHQLQNGFFLKYIVLVPTIYQLGIQNEIFFVHSGPSIITGQLAPFDGHFPVQNLIVGAPFSTKCFSVPIGVEDVEYASAAGCQVPAYAAKQPVDLRVCFQVLQYPKGSNNQVEGLSQVKIGNVAHLDPGFAWRNTGFGQLSLTNGDHGWRKINPVNIAAMMAQRQRHATGAASQLKNGGLLGGNEVDIEGDVIRQIWITIVVLGSFGP